MRIKPDDILNIGFSTGVMGYDRREVDAFLDDVAEEMRHLEREKSELKAMVSKMSTELKKLQSATKGELPPLGLDTGADGEEENLTSRVIRKNTGDRNRKGKPAFNRPKPMGDETGKSGIAASEEATDAGVPQKIAAEGAVPQEKEETFAEKAETTCANECTPSGTPETEPQINHSEDIPNACEDTAPSVSEEETTTLSDDKSANAIEDTQAASVPENAKPKENSLLETLRRIGMHSKEIHAEETKNGETDGSKHE
ncbi:MAG: DivIVA domain-containing protein [Clostridia bacterium]|nr:DivIVA domain-containing protein [Clostridia bacterium]